jgi:hypothetical protein
VLEVLGPSIGRLRESCFGRLHLLDEPCRLVALFGLPLVYGTNGIAQRLMRLAERQTQLHRHRVGRWHLERFLAWLPWTLLLVPLAA